MRWWNACVDGPRSFKISGPWHVFRTLCTLPKSSYVANQVHNNCFERPAVFRYWQRNIRLYMSYCCSDPYENSDRTQRAMTYAYDRASRLWLLNPLLTHTPSGPVRTRMMDTNEPQHDKTNKLTCAPSENSDQPGHPPSLMKVFARCALNG